MNFGNINYWRKSTNDLIFNTTGGGTTTQPHTTHLECMNEHMGIMKHHWNHVVSIPSTTANVYNVNIQRVVSFERATANITVTFDDESTLVVTLLNSTVATDVLRWANHMLHSWTWLSSNYYSRIHYVHEGDSIQTAINNASSGELVYITAGSYNDNTVAPKNGVDVYCERGMVHTVTTNQNWKWTSEANCRIMGFGHFINTGTDHGDDSNFTCAFNCDVFIQGYKFECWDGFAPFLQYAGKMHVNGYQTRGWRNYDDDFNSALCFYQIYDNISATAVSFFPDNNVATYLYVMNGNFSTVGVGSGEGLFYLQGSQPYHIFFANVMAKGINEFITSPSIGWNECRLWNCIYDNDGGNLFAFTSLDAVTVTIYDEFSTNVPSHSPVTVSGTMTVASITVDFADNVSVSILPVVGAVGSITMASETYDGRLLDVDVVTSLDTVNPTKYEVYKDCRLIYNNVRNTNILDVMNGNYNGNYIYRGYVGNEFTEFSNVLNKTFMALTNMPVKSKFTVSDDVVAVIDGVITELTVSRVRVVVTNPENDENGLQVNYYSFAESSIELDESKVYASHDHCLSVLKGQYLNVDALTPANDIAFDIANTPSFRDMAGKTFAGANFNTEPFDFTGSVIDNASFEGCTLPTGQTTKAQIRTAVASYDELTTLWTDGEPIGRTG